MPEARELFLAAAIEGKPAELEHAEVVSRLELAYTYCSEALAYAAVNDVSEVENIDLHLEILEESRQGFQHALDSYL